MADFVSKYTSVPEKEDLKKPVWILHVVGSSTQGESGAGLLLKGPHDVKVSYALKFGSMQVTMKPSTKH